MDSATGELTTDQLRRQLDEQRSEIGDDLVAIGDRVSPKRVAERRTAAVKQKVGGVREAVMGAKDTVADKASGVGDQVSGAGGAVADKASAAADQLRQAPELARNQTQGNPIAAGVIAFGAGMLAATLLPSTRKEQQLVAERVQPQLDEAASHVGELAQETVEAVRPAAEQAATELKDEAQERVAAVKDEASTAAGEVADDAKQQAGDLRS